MNQDSFISQFLEFTKDFESPTSFWRWSAYGAISATLRFNCYINWGSSNLYPNTFILLLADSAAYRKDAGPELVGELLKEHAHTKVISGRATWPGIIDELSTDIGNKRTGVPIKDGAGIMIAKEFTAMFISDPSLVRNMTEAYSYEEEFQDTLRGGKSKIKKRCLSILGGSNETLLRSVFSNEAVYGGLLRRYFLVKPDKKRPPNCLVDDTTTITITPDKRKKLIDALRKISTLSGVFKLSDDAKRAYKEWYEDLYHNYEKFDDRTGFIQGVHALIIKIAMIMAANENTLVIDERSISASIKEVMALKENYVTYIMGAGKNPHADMGAAILGALWQLHLKANNGITPLWKRRDILLQYWNQISSEDLDKLLLTLEGAQLIQMLPQGSEPAYLLTLKAQEIFLKNAKTNGQTN